MRRCLIVILILGLYPLRAQSLSARDIRVLNAEIQTLPDEMVLPDEVAVIETDFGNIVIEFFSLSEPLHAMNFKKLANAGYYDSTTFHRVVPGFVIQGGDILSRDANPANDGTGGPGYTIPAELGRTHQRGTVAAARLPDNLNPRQESSGSQFYICLVNLTSLDRAGYTVFGRVVRGMRVVDKIAGVDCDQRDRPLKDVIMSRVYVTRRSALNLR